jgi:hypothetical protein
MEVSRSSYTPFFGLLSSPWKDKSFLLNYRVLPRDGDPHLTAYSSVYSTAAIFPQAPFHCRMAATELKSSLGKPNRFSDDLGWFMGERGPLPVAADWPFFYY